MEDARNLNDVKVIFVLLRIAILIKCRAISSFEHVSRQHFARKVEWASC